MTDRAINFTAIVESIRDDADDDTVVSVTGTDPIDVCERLVRRLGSASEGDASPDQYEFYMSPNTNREIERGLVSRGPDAASLDFLERRIRTDVSMPEDAVLFAGPDGVTLGGTPTGAHPVGVGTISSDA